MNRFTNFFRLLFMRLRGPKHKIGLVVPYYGGATTITKTTWDRRHGWAHSFEGVDGNWEFTESLVTFYLDNPYKDGRHYGYRNKG